MANNAKLFDVNELIKAGMDRNGLPLKKGSTPEVLKEQEKMLLRIMDEQEAINRYVWYNLPSGLNGQMIERMLYYKYSLAFFYVEDDDGGAFYCLPYALSGDIDVYGRFNKITPCIFGGSTKAKDNVWIDGMEFDVVKEMPMDAKKALEAFTGGCVLIRDYTQQLNEVGISRQILQDGLIETLAEAVPLARTNMFANSGIKAMRVNDETAESNVAAANLSIEHAALSGKYMIPITSTIDFQDVTNSGSAMKAQDFMVYLEALNNHRLSFLGIDNAGTYQKSTYVNQAQASGQLNATQLVLQDGLTQRQRACDIINSIWNLGVYVDINEAIVGDVNMDGVAMEEQDQSGELDGEQEIIYG